MLRLYDSATQEVRPLAQREPGTVSIYLCGPTVYGPPHVGHGRSTITYDIMRRYLEWRGTRVRLVSNVTDIDDKIIELANRQGRSAAAVAEEWERVWWQAMDAAGFERPTVTPHATEYVEQMVSLVADLVERDAAYVTDDGVYLDLKSVPDYGLLAHQSLEDMLVGGGEREVLGADKKRHPGDFALWKLAKEGEPAWPSPWGPGRPGWHTECVVMSLDLLGDGFDLHAGGQDLRFPHHENERAQAMALGKRFANHWMHHGFIVDPTGEKMSKSLGNFDDLLELLADHDARAFRMVLLQAHYRSPLSISRDTIEQAERSVARLDAFARRTDALPRSEPDPTVLAAFVERMDDDLDTPGAMAVAFDTVTRANAALDAADSDTASRLAAAVRAMCGAVGFTLRTSDELPPAVTTKLDALDRARGARDFATADALRAELQGDGWIIETTKAGTTARRA